MRKVPKLLGSFRVTHSHVTIEVCDAPSEQLVEMLTEQQLDAVLTILDESASKFASRVLFKEPSACFHVKRQEGDEDNSLP
jgi:DNA-binding transcriptional LysR family regulator